MKHPLRIGMDAGTRALSLARSARLAKWLTPALAPEGRPSTMLLSLVVAVSVAALVSGLYGVTELLVHWRTGTADALPTWAASIFVVGLPILGAVGGGAFMARYAPDTAGSGIPEIKVAYHIRAGMMRGRDAVFKLVLTALAIGSGLSLGREGPSIYAGAVVGSWMGQRVAIKRARIKQLSAVGAACGMAAAFNAPIAAIMFLLEEIVGDLRHALFGAVVVAVVVSTAVSAGLVGDVPLLGHVEHAFFGLEIFAYTLLGIIAGLAGRVFIQLLMSTRRWASAHCTGRRVYLRHAIGGGATGLLALIVYWGLNWHLIGASGIHDIATILASGLPLAILAAILVGKMLATALSYMTLLPGGIFGPSLLMGATLGALVAGAINLAAAHLDIPMVDVGAFAVVGMAAFFGGVARAPMTAAMIVVEITDDYGLILPLMLATALAMLIVQLKYRGSVYDVLLRQGGVNLHAHEQHALLASTTVEEVMSHEVRTLPHEITIDAALRRVEGEDPHCLYIVTGPDGLMTGVVSPTDLVWEVAHKNGKRPLSAFVSGQRIIHAHPDQELDNVIEKITHFEFTEYPVVPRGNERQVIGIVGLHEITLFRHKVEAEDIEDLRTADLPIVRVDNAT